MTGTEYESIRRGIGLSQAELATRLDVSRTTIHLRESGKTPIGKEAAYALERLADRMGFDITYRHTAKPTQGRNDPCACGSGRKFKHCCGK